MSAERLAEIVGRATDRKGFLKKTGGASVGAVLGVMGLSSTASAHHCGSGTHHYRCCCLCHPAGDCRYICSWCWSCRAGDGCTYRCCERYASTAYGCDAGCGGVICSTYWRTGC